MILLWNQGAEQGLSDYLRMLRTISDNNLPIL